jgi:hypothetical protein
MVVVFLGKEVRNVLKIKVKKTWEKWKTTCTQCLGIK